jgi:hypothetical protein
MALAKASKICHGQLSAKAGAVATQSRKSLGTFIRWVTLGGWLSHTKGTRRIMLRAPRKEAVCGLLW